MRSVPVLGLLGHYYRHSSVVFHGLLPQQIDLRLHTHISSIPNKFHARAIKLVSFFCSSVARVDRLGLGIGQDHSYGTSITSGCRDIVTSASSERRIKLS